MNHAERREMESVLIDRGMTPESVSPDIEIVHTCSVTGQAAAKSRNAIRRARKNGKHVLITGCFTGTDPEVAQELGDTIVQQAGESPMLERFTHAIDSWLEKPTQLDEQPNTTSLPIATLPTARGQHIRAELRIQDGCDAHCTFCIIPKIRTTLRSKTIEDAVSEATRLVELGHKEVVLTGIFIGAYGHETALRRKQSNSDGEYLADLLDAVAQIDGLQRLRISSMEPGDVTPVLLDAMLANQTVVAPHLHLPLQSGSDAVLQKMNRQYNTTQYLEMIDMVNERLTDDGLPPAITTDIICGFPTETEEDFKKTVHLATQVGYLHMHVFPYSFRAGTAAARWKQLPAAIVQDRVQHMLTLDPILSLAFRHRLIGRRVMIMVEQKAEEQGFMLGRCGHYAEIILETAAKQGDLIPAQITHIDGPATFGLSSLRVLN